MISLRRRRDRQRPQSRIFTGSCPIREHTGDGAYVEDRLREASQEALVALAALRFGDVPERHAHEVWAQMMMAHDLLLAALLVSPSSSAPGDRVRVVHLPTGKEGSVNPKDHRDLVLVKWDAGYASNVDHAELRYLNGGGRV